MGRKVGRTIYDAAPPEGRLIGIMDRIEDARLAAAAPELLEACKAVLLFHSVEWDEDKRAEWTAITGETTATTKILCDHIRKCVAKAEDWDEHE